MFKAPWVEQISGKMQDFSIYNYMFTCITYTPTHWTRLHIILEGVPCTQPTCTFFLLF